MGRSVPPAVGADAEEPRSAFQRAVDFLFGYDFFVSYAWRDARPYAVALAEKLRAQGFECFLDSRDYAKGENWRRSGRRALRKTARLLLLGSPGALDSEPVLHEVRAYQRRGRLVVPVDFGGTLRRPPDDSPLLRELSPDILRVAEDLDRLPVGPSEAVLRDIRDGFQLLRQQQRRLRWFAGAAGLFALVAAAAVAAGIASELRRREATSRGLGAQAVIEADRQLDLALLLAAEAAEVSVTTQSSAVLLAALHRAPLDYFLHHRDGRGSFAAVAAHPTRAGRVATADWGGEVAMWDLAARCRETAVRAGPGQLHAVAFSPGGARLAAGGADGTLTVWAVGPAALQPAQVVPHPQPAIIRKLLFLDETRVLVAADRVGLVVCDLNRGEWKKWPAGHSATPSVLMGIPGDPPRVLTAGSDGRALLWTPGPAGFGLPQEFAAGDWVLSAAVSADGHWLALGLHDHGLQLWDLARGQRVAALPASMTGGGRLFTVGFLPRTLANEVFWSGDDGTLHVLGMGTGVARTYAAHRDAVLDAVWTADTGRLITAGRDGKLGVWDFGRSSPVAHEWFRWISPNGWATATALDGAGNVILIGDERGTLHRLETATGRPRGEPRPAAHDGRIHALLARPEGVGGTPVQNWASAGQDGFVRFWAAGERDLEETRPGQRLPSPPLRLAHGVRGGRWPLLALTANGTLHGLGPADGSPEPLGPAVPAEPGTESSPPVLAAHPHRTVVAVGRKFSLWFYDYERRQGRKVDGFDGAVSALRYTPDGRDCSALTGPSWTCATPLPAPCGPRSRPVG